MKDKVVTKQPYREAVAYVGANGVRIDALADVDTVWLNRQQLATLFGRDIKTIGNHIANAVKEELQGMATVAKFATVQTEGGREVTRQVEYYDLDMILSVGYRVKSPEGVRFRRWANGVLKSILMHRAHDARFLKELERRLADHEGRIADAEKVIKYVVNTLMPPVTNRKTIGFHPDPEN